MSLGTDFTGFKQGQLVQMKKNFTDMLLYVNQALKLKMDLHDIDSRSKLEEATANRVTCPDFYYNFRLFDKAVSISFGGFVYDTQLKRQVYKKSYHIKYHNWRPEDSHDPVFNEENGAFNYGDYETLEDTFEPFSIAILELIRKTFGFGFQLLIFAE